MKKFIICAICAICGFTTANAQAKFGHVNTQEIIQAMPEFGSHYTKQKMISIPGRVTDPSSPEKGCPFAPRCSFAKSECKEVDCVCWKMADTSSSETKSDMQNSSSSGETL